MRREGRCCFFGPLGATLNGLRASETNKNEGDAGREKCIFGPGGVRGEDLRHLGLSSCFSAHLLQFCVPNFGVSSLAGLGLSRGPGGPQEEEGDDDDYDDDDDAFGLVSLSWS